MSQYISSNIFMSIYFHLFVIFSFFYQCLRVFFSNTSLLVQWFIHRYFILIDATCKTVFLIFLYDSSLLIYRNLLHFYISILYPASVLNSLSSNHFLILSLGFSIFNIMSSVKIVYILSSLDSFLFIVWLLWLVLILNIMLNAWLPRCSYL